MVREKAGFDKRAIDEARRQSVAATRQGHAAGRDAPVPAYNSDIRHAASGDDRAQTRDPVAQRRRVFGRAKLRERAPFKHFPPHAHQFGEPVIGVLDDPEQIADGQRVLRRIQGRRQDVGTFLQH